MINDNERLFSILTGHALFIEAYKKFSDLENAKLLREYKQDLRKLLSKIDIETKRDLKDALAKIRKLHAKFYDKRFLIFLKQIENLLEFEKSFLDALLESEVVEKDDTTIVPLLILSNKKIRQKLGVNESAAFGSSVGQEKTNLVASAFRRIKRVIVTGFVDKIKAFDIYVRLVGSKRLKFKDGKFRLLTSHLNAYVHTALHHYVMQMQNVVLSTIAKRYQWQSVVDSRTTEICKSRHTNIYEFGKGPLPPAHPRCRSQIMPINDDGTTPKSVSFRNWLKNQDNDFLNLVYRKRDGIFDTENMLNLKDIKPRDFDFLIKNIDKLFKKKG